MMSVQCVKMVGSSSAVMGVLAPSTSPAWCRPSPPYPGTEQSCDTQATDPIKPVKFKTVDKLHEFKTKKSLKYETVYNKYDPAV